VQKRKCAVLKRNFSGESANDKIDRLTQRFYRETVGSPDRRENVDTLRFIKSVARVEFVRVFKTASTRYSAKIFLR
jgi:hypothetical protein